MNVETCRYVQEYSCGRHGRHVSLPGVVINEQDKLGRMKSRGLVVGQAMRQESVVVNARRVWVLYSTVR